LFRNYDGSGAKFGDTYVSSTSADQGKLSVYGAQRSSDGAVTAVVINKTGSALTSSLAVKDFAGRGTAQVWRYSAANLTKIVRHSDIATSASTSLTFPASSATLLVFPAVAKTQAVGVVHPSSLTAPARVTYSAPVAAVPTSSVSLTEAATGKRVAFRTACRNGAAVVSCSAGPVTSVAVTPTAGWLPGDRYRLVITGDLVVDNAFRATTLVPATSRAVTYRWASVRTPKAYGGSVLVADRPGASASYKFTGASVTWFSATGPAQGIADVYIDGKHRAIVNGYSGKTKQRVAHRLVRLGPGPHVLTIKARGTKGSRHGTGTRVSIDAVRVGAGKVVVSPALTATWSSGPHPRASTVGESAAVTFVGTGIRWTALMSPKTTRLTVYLDGRRRSPGGQGIAGLALGRHRLTLTVAAGSVALGAFRVA
jgi:hypothetical protein